MGGHRSDASLYGPVMPCRLIRPSLINAIATLALATVTSLSIDGYQCAAQPPTGAGDAKQIRQEAAADTSSRAPAQAGLKGSAGSGLFS